MKAIQVILVCLLVGLASCRTGTESEGVVIQAISIFDLTFFPSALEARAGETIVVVNSDTVAHTITSESEEDAFDDTSDDPGGFDTGPMPAGSSASLTIPEGVAVNETLFFYCDIHKGDMVTPNGTITIIE